MREYLSVQEASSIIASEVTKSGASKNWVGNAVIAKELEKHLAKFNIGYTDPNSGTWAHRRNGTRYFVTMQMVNGAKAKLGGLLSSFKKQ